MLVFSFHCKLQVSAYTDVRCVIVPVSASDMVYTVIMIFGCVVAIHRSAASAV